MRHARTVLGMRGEPGPILKRLDRHYAKFGDQRFRSYWFELWDFYEGKRGPAWTWEPRTTGRTFTASAFRADEAKAAAAPPRRRPAPAPARRG